MGCTHGKVVNSELINIEQNTGGHRFSDLYLLQCRLGRGSYGQVFLTTGDNGQEYATKILDLSQDDVTVHPGRKRKACAEAKMWYAVGAGPHVVGLLAHFWDEDGFLFMLMEKCSCSLVERLEVIEEASPATLIQMYRDMLHGISHLHQMSIAHRDVKPDNFLVSESDQGSVVKLADFGLACVMPSTGRLQQQCGTPPYMSPELLRGNGYGLKTDVWSYGASVYLLTFGHMPYSPPGNSRDAIKRAIKENRHGPAFVRADAGKPPSGMVAFTQSLLTRNEKSRPSSKEALRLPFLTSPAPRTRTESTEYVKFGPAVSACRIITQQCFAEDHFAEKAQMERRLAQLMVTDLQYNKYSPRRLQSKEGSERSKSPLKRNLSQGDATSQRGEVLSSSLLGGSPSKTSKVKSPGPTLGDVPIPKLSPAEKIQQVLDQRARKTVVLSPLPV